MAKPVTPVFKNNPKEEIVLDTTTPDSHPIYTHRDEPGDAWWSRWELTDAEVDYIIENRSLFIGLQSKNDTTTKMTVKAEELLLTDEGEVWSKESERRHTQRRVQSFLRGKAFEEKRRQGRRSTDLRD